MYSNCFQEFSEFNFHFMIKFSWVKCIEVLKIYSFLLITPFNEVFLKCGIYYA